MTTDLKTLVQEVYFDLCDVIDGNSYKRLGYDNRVDFMLAQRDKISTIEKLIKEQQHEY